ncbi:MAG: hypothetical protein ACYC99_00725 [Candidatus Geothermincolia bacterium]
MGLFDMISGSGREPNIKGAVPCPRCGLNLSPSIERCPACDQNTRAPVTQPLQQAMPQQPYPPQQPYAQQQFGAQFAAPQYGAAAAAFAQDMSQVPPAPSEETGQQYPAPGMQPAPPQAPPGAVIGVIQHDIVIENVVAFRNGERVYVEAESPDPGRPEYKFVVFCPALNKRFRLSDLDIFF